MQNPFSPQPDQGSYLNVRERIFRNVRAARVSDQIFEIVQKAYEESLEKENILLSRPERIRLLSQTLKFVLEDMLKKLEDHSSSRGA